ncbi:acyltransferase family protein [Elongatibacter sediminis]|uniref:Acyltransferase n=1 Tax=Elongatibacter sediminis TaxID=3119006 RepID=A0AAW9RHC6_9GAMM
MPERREFIGYRPRLDGLRAVAIGAVLTEHLGGYLAKPFMAGYYGVDLFFVISGFLITSILLNDQTPTFRGSYRKFIGRRVLRIFPIYYLTIFCLLIVDYPSAREMFPWLASYTYNYGVVLNKEPGSGAPLFYLWSLSVEEQFYLFWPLLVISLRKRLKILSAITLVIVVASYVQLTVHLITSLVEFNYTGLPARMGSLGLGALGAILVAWNALPSGFFNDRRVEVIVLLSLLLTLTLTFRLQFIVMGLCSLYLVLKAASFGFRTTTVDRFLLHPAVIYVGAISYGIYLFHVPVAVLMTEHVFDHFWLALPWEKFGEFGVIRWHSWIIKFPVYCAATIALAALSYRWVESPMLVLKDRWFKYSSARAGQVAA